MIAARVIVNPLTKIGLGSIISTGCIIEHECLIGDFVHVGPGAVISIEAILAKQLITKYL